MYKKGLVIILVLLLAGGNIYLYSQKEKLDYSILIGTPIGSGSSVHRTDFNKPLEDKNESNLLIFSLMSGVSIDKPKVCDKLPYSTIWFNHWDIGVTYYIVNLWVDDNTIITETEGSNNKNEYKIIDGDRAKELIKIMEKYKI